MSKLTEGVKDSSDGDVDRQDEMARTLGYERVDRLYIRSVK